MLALQWSSATFGPLFAAAAEDDGPPIHAFNLNGHQGGEVQAVLYVAVPNYETKAQQDDWDPSKQPHKKV